MSLYLVAFVVLVVGSVASFSKRMEKASYFISFGMLTLMLAFRFGQGTDWFAYNYIFNQAPMSVDLSSGFYSGSVHGEFGWKLINNLAKAVGLGFTGVTIPLSILEMLLVNRFLTNYAPNRTLGLLVLYPTVYLTYFFSALRQGLVIAVFLGLMVKWFQEKSYLQYVVCAVVLCSVHLLSLALLLPLLVVRVPVRSVAVILVACLIIGALGFYWIPTLSGYFGARYANNVSPLALGYRITQAAFIYFLYQSSERRGSTLDSLLLLYSVGMSVYLLFMTNELVASRLSLQLMSLDSALIPLLMADREGRKKALCLLLVALLAAVMTVKNVDSYISQGSYFPGVSVMNYPYVSVFNQDDIYLYRTNRYILQ